MGTLHDELVNKGLAVPIVSYEDAKAVWRDEINNKSIIAKRGRSVRMPKHAESYTPPGETIVYNQGESLIDTIAKAIGHKRELFIAEIVEIRSKLGATTNPSTLRAYLSALTAARLIKITGSISKADSLIAVENDVKTENLKDRMLCIYGSKRVRTKLRGIRAATPSKPKKHTFPTEPKPLVVQPGTKILITPIFSCRQCSEIHAAIFGGVNTLCYKTMRPIPEKGIMETCPLPLGVNKSLTTVEDMP